MPRTRRLTSDWPFLWSVVLGRRGLVKNLPPKAVKPKRLRAVPASSNWVQETLL